MSRRVLVVEDNKDLALGLHNNLEIEGYDVVTVGDGDDALQKLHETDLMILDLMLPSVSGMRVLRESRRNGFSGPILVLTARGEEADKVRALRLGADDYVTKPFGLLELLARVEALLRRAGAQPSPESFSLGDLVIHVSKREVRRAGVSDESRSIDSIDLTPKELDLLLALVEAEGAVVSRADLLSKVWGYQDDVYTRTVDTHVAELRRKIEADPKAPRYVITVRKAGYRIASRMLSEHRS